MTDKHLSVKIPEALSEALESVAHEAHTSKSQVVREYLSDAVLDSDDPMPEHLRQQVRREKMKQRNRLEWQRVHFPSNVADKFRRAFEQGDLDGKLGEGAIDSLRGIYVEDAKLLFEDDPERREAAIEYVEAVADHAQGATEASDFDALDPEEMFERYSGVQDSRQQSTGANKRDEILGEYNERKRRLNQRGKSPDREAVIGAVANQMGVSESAVETAISQEGRDL